jgi:hypothetical protein
VDWNFKRTISLQTKQVFFSDLIKFFRKFDNVRWCHMKLSFFACWHWSSKYSWNSSYFWCSGTKCHKEITLVPWKLNWRCILHSLGAFITVLFWQSQKFQWLLRQSSSHSFEHIFSELRCVLAIYKILFVHIWFSSWHFYECHLDFSYICSPQVEVANIKILFQQFSKIIWSLFNKFFFEKQSTSSSRI